MESVGIMDIEANFSSFKFSTIRAAQWWWMGFLMWGGHSEALWVECKEQIAWHFLWSLRKNLYCKVEL